MEQSKESNEGSNIIFLKLAQEFRRLDSVSQPKYSNFAAKLRHAADNLMIHLRYTLYDSPVEKNDLTYFESEIRVDSFLLATGLGLSELASKYKTYTTSIEKLCSLVPVEDEIDISQESLSQEKLCPLVPVEDEIDFSQEPFCIPHGQKINQALPKNPKYVHTQEYKQSLSHFVLLQSVMTEQNSVDILNASSKVNKNLIQFEWNNVDSGFLCRIYMGSYRVGECEGQTQTSSKEKASDKALETLRLYSWTIIKNPADAGSENITREDLIGNVCKINEPLSSENIGNKLLQKMGWIGGGIGKSGNKGIVEPISVQDVGNIRQLGNRAGLGKQSQHGDVFNIDIEPKIRSVLKKYAWSSNPDHITFSGPFSPAEVKIIRQESRKLGLSTNVRGLKLTPVITVSQNWENHQVSWLLNVLMECGGSSRDYSILPPLESQKSAAHNINAESYEDFTSSPDNEEFTPESAEENLENGEVVLVDKFEPNPLPSTITREYLNLKVDSRWDRKVNLHEEIRAFLFNYSWSADDKKLMFSEFTKKEKTFVQVESESMGLVNYKCFSKDKPVLIVQKNLTSTENVEVEKICKADLGVFTKKVIKSHFRQGVEDVLLEYLDSSSHNDLKFSNEFGTKVRHIIQQKAKRLGLEGCTIGTGHKRHLVVSKVKNTNSEANNNQEGV